MSAPDARFDQGGDRRLTERPTGHGLALGGHAVAELPSVPRRSRQSIAADPAAAATATVTSVQAGTIRSGATASRSAASASAAPA